jgi:hypothetical protein
LRGGRPAPGAQHRGAHFAFGLGGFKNGTNGKSQPSEFLNDFKSSEVGKYRSQNFDIEEFSISRLTRRFDIEVN